MDHMCWSAAEGEHTPTASTQALSPPPETFSRASRYSGSFFDLVNDQVSTLFRSTVPPYSHPIYPYNTRAPSRTRPFRAVSFCLLCFCIYYLPFA